MIGLYIVDLRKRRDPAPVLDFGAVAGGQSSQKRL